MLRRATIPLLVLVLALALGASACGGKKKSNGFGAATQPPPAATNPSTSQATHPVHVRHRYARPLEKSFMTGCTQSGATTAMCGCALRKLEEMPKPPPLTAKALAPLEKRIVRACRK
jgi:hypothetical protein